MKVEKRLEMGRKELDRVRVLVPSAKGVGANARRHWNYICRRGRSSGWSSVTGSRAKKV